MQKLFVLIIFFLTCSNHVFANPHESIVVTKFAGFKDGKGGVLAAYTKGAQGWTPSSFRAYADSDVFNQVSNVSGNCLNHTLDSLFKQSQLFAMNKYLETGYLSKVEVEKYISNSVDFTDRPVTFFHYLSSEAPPKGLNAYAGEEASFRLGFLKDKNTAKNAMPEDGYVRASLYTVAGQKMELAETAEVANMKFLELPWTKDPQFRKFSQNFKRENYPLVWEIGRAASTGNTEFPQLLGMAGQDILKELMHYGVPNESVAEHAFVSFHALNAENMEKFSKLFPGRVIAHAENDVNNAVYMVPLKEFFEKFPPARYTEGHKIMKEALGPNRSVAQNQAFIDAFKFSQYVPLDVRYKGKNLETPVIFTSIPSGYSYLPMDKLAEKYGVKSEDFYQMLKKNNGVFASQGVSTDVAWPGKMVDPLVPHKITQFQGQSVFQIGNLDPVLAKTDPDYVISNLVAMFDHYARQFMPQNMPNENILPQLVQELKRNNVRFMVTTHYPSTADAIQKLVPKQKFKIDLTHDPHTSVSWQEITKQSGGAIKRPSNEMQGFVFDLDQIGAFRYYVYHKNQLDPKKLPMIRPGYHWWLQGASEP